MVRVFALLLSFSMLPPSIASSQVSPAVTATTAPCGQVDPLSKPTPPALYVPNRTRLTQTAHLLGDCDRGTYSPSNGMTFCNFFAQNFSKKYLGEVPPELEGLANHIHETLLQNAHVVARSGDPLTRGWNRLAYFHTAQSAGYAAVITAAANGLFAVASYKNPVPGHHGHIVIIVPGSVRGAPSWGEPDLTIPMVAQAGESVFAQMPITQSFGPSLKDSFDLFILAP